MNKVYVLYTSCERVHLSGTEVLPLDIPLLDFNLTNRFGLLYIGSTKSETLNTIIYDKRGSYVKCGDHQRYYRPFMDIFKYQERNPEFCIGVHLLESSVPDDQLNTILNKYLVRYRLIYGDRLILDGNIKKMLIDYTNVDHHVREVYGPSIPKAERQVLSRKKYEDHHRDRLNAKSKRYYESHKEILKAKRAAKNVIPAVVDNTADYQLSCHGC